MTEIESLLLAAKSFNSNLVHFLPPYYVINKNVHVCSFIGTISHLHGRAPKTVLHEWNIVNEKL